MLAALVERRTACLRRLGGSRAGEVRFGRFLRSAAVTAEEMVATAALHTAAAAKGRHVLAIQDTSELNFAGQAGRKRGFGTVGNGSDIGLFVHPVLVADAGSGGILGLVEALVHNRTARPAIHRKQRPLAEKESRRWLDGLKAACELLDGARMVTVVCDREGDVYGELVARRPAHVHLLIRAGQDRSLVGGGRLFAAADLLAEAGRRQVEVPARPGRPARTAELAIGFGEVAIARPAYLARTGPAEVRLRLVTAREIDPPAARNRSAGGC